MSLENAVDIADLPLPTLAVWYFIYAFTLPYAATLRVLHASYE